MIISPELEKWKKKLLKKCKLPTQYKIYITSENQITVTWWAM